MLAGYVRGRHLGRSLDQELTLTALRRALNDHWPAIHHPDQGVQYAAEAYVEALGEHDILISIADVSAAS